MDKGRPWDTAKNVEQSAPLGIVHPLSEIGHPVAGRIALTLNGATRQAADIGDMIGPSPTGSVRRRPDRLCLALLSARAGRPDPYRTPAGVGAVRPGDRIAVSIAGLSDGVVTIGVPG